MVQPPSKQWQNLAESLDRCLVLADRPQGHIFVAWCAHTGTRRISGIHVHPTAANVRDEEKWEKAILWAAGDFGFRNCPIFRVDILSADEEGVELGPLRCYTKDGNSRTILAASKKPTQLHPNGGDLSTLLPSTDKIVWEWQDKKCHAIGKVSSKYKLQEIQEIAEQGKISALSTKNREKALAELRYASTVEEWKRENWQREEKQRKKEEEAGKAREAEIANLQKYAETRKKIEAKSREIRATVVGTLSGGTQKVAELPANRKWDVLGFRGKEGKFRVVLRHGKEEAVAVWTTKGLQKILLGCVDCFRSDEKDSFGRQLFWLVSASGFEKLAGLELHIEPSRSFQNWEGTTTRLYRIWKDAAAIEPTQNKPKKAVEPKQAPETKTEQTSKLLYQILDNVHDLQKNMDLLLGVQESHFEDVEDIGADLHGLEVGVEETKDGILQSIEKNSNAVHEKTDRIVAACGVVEAVGIVLGLGGVALLLWTCGSRKLQQWKAAQSDTPPEKEQLDAPPKKEPLAVHKGVRALE